MVGSARSSSRGPTGRTTTTGARTWVRCFRPVLAVAISASVLSAGVAAAPGAAAAGDTGARSQLVGRGEILTSIFGNRTTTPRRSSPAARPTCVWITLSDADLEWFVELTVLANRLGTYSPLLDVVGAHRDGPLPDGDYQLRRCDGVLVDARYVVRDGPLPTTEVLLRQMITRLPVPDPVLSPPVGTLLPVGQPLFVSIPAEQWQSISGVLAHDDLTAEVRARPVGLRLVSGDPAADSIDCIGPGRPFDHASRESPLRQARRADTCTATYRTANLTAPRSPGVIDDRPAAWIGAVTVVWQVDWRVDDGAWRSLGTVQRTRLVDRAVRELVTAIRSTR